jgi:hypothetical protein
VYVNACNGGVGFHKDLALTIKCLTDYSWYPFDTQTCTYAIFLVGDSMPLGKYWALAGRSPGARRALAGTLYSRYYFLLSLAGQDRSNILLNKDAQIELKWRNTFLVREGSEQKIGNFEEFLDVIQNSPKQQVWKRYGGYLMV